MKTISTPGPRMSRFKAIAYALGATILFGLGGCSTDFIHSRSSGGYGHSTRHHDYGHQGRGGHRTYDHGPRQGGYRSGYRSGDLCDTGRCYQ